MGSKNPDDLFNIDEECPIPNCSLFLLISTTFCFICIFAIFIYKKIKSQKRKIFIQLKAINFENDEKNVLDKERKKCANFFIENISVQGDTKANLQEPEKLHDESIISQFNENKINMPKEGKNRILNVQCLDNINNQDKKIDDNHLKNKLRASIQENIEIEDFDQSSKYEETKRKEKEKKKKSSKSKKLFSKS